MRARISRWGNSLALRIPRGVVESTGLNDGDVVDVREEDHGILRISRIARPRATIDERIDAITPENLNIDHEWLDMPPMGEEVLIAADVPA